MDETEKESNEESSKEYEQLKQKVETMLEDVKPIYDTIEFTYKYIKQHE